MNISVILLFSAGNSNECPSACMEKCRYHKTTNGVAFVACLGPRKANRILNVVTGQEGEDAGCDNTGGGDGGCQGGEDGNVEGTMRPDN